MLSKLKWALIVASLALVVCGPARADSSYEPCTSITPGSQPCFYPQVQTTPATGSAGSVTPVASTVTEAAHVLKAGAGSLYAWQVTTGASAGFAMLFDATSAPADGAVTPVKCVAVAANSTVGATLVLPEAFADGVVAVFSTTGCFTKTASATAFFSGDVK